MIRIYSVSLGCPKIEGYRAPHWLSDVKVTPVEDITKADVILINTCGFILPAVEESVRTIVEALDDIEDMASPKKRPYLAVAGCLVGRYGAKELSAELPEVDLGSLTKNGGMASHACLRT